jgi:hypothetical protein
LTPDQTATWLDKLAEELAAAVADVPHGNPRRRAVLTVAAKLRGGAAAVRGLAPNAPAAVPLADTVPVAVLRRLASLGRAMREAQRAYFLRRKNTPHVPADTEWKAARDAEGRFDAAVGDALNRECQPSLPGMGAGEGGDDRA